MTQFSKAESPLDYLGKRIGHDVLFLTSFPMTCNIKRKMHETHISSLINH